MHYNFAGRQLVRNLLPPTDCSTRKPNVLDNKTLRLDDVDQLQRISQ